MFIIPSDDGTLVGKRLRYPASASAVTYRRTFGILKRQTRNRTDSIA